MTRRGDGDEWEDVVNGKPGRVYRFCTIISTTADDSPVEVVDDEGRVRMTLSTPSAEDA